MATKMMTDVKTTVSVNVDMEEKTIGEKVAPKGVGCLDMVIAFDTTGSMASYIDDVRKQVKEMIPRLFKENEDLRLGIVAFGDYCDMSSAGVFGAAYQCLPLTDNENDIISFVGATKNTSGGDGDEFYELVLKKIIEEMPWREEASKAILLIADAEPHPVGYTYQDYVVGNQIDWRVEARKAADRMIKIDTVSICGAPWYKELAAMTNGICVPFRSSEHTATMVETATMARSAISFRKSGDHARYEALRDELRSRAKAMTADAERSGIFASYLSAVDAEEKK